MEFGVEFWAVVGGSFALAAVALGLFFVARRSQKVMQSLLSLLVAPEQTRISAASAVVQNIMMGEIERMESNFKRIEVALAAHIQKAEELDMRLNEKNSNLVTSVNTAAQNMVEMTSNLDTAADVLKKILESKQWVNAEKSTVDFHSRINELLKQIDNTVHDASEKSRVMTAAIDGWIESGAKLSGQLQSDFENNTSYMNSLVQESDAMRVALDGLSKSVESGFGDVRAAAADYESVMSSNEKLLGKQIEKMDAFTKQSKSLLVTQMNGLTNTANVVGGQIRLAESSIEKQERILAEAVGKLMESAQITESAVNNISTEVSILTGKFQSEVREFASGVVSELNTVYGVANTTLKDTEAAAGAFSSSVNNMATGVRETLIEMKDAYSKLSGQSDSLIQISVDTTDKLQPLSELIEKYYSALPDLTRSSSEMTTQLSGDIVSLDEKIRGLNDAVQQSIVGIADSSLKLDHLSGQSRQQMIDLMSDYAKAVDTMKTLNRQMIEARASAPMAAMSRAPTPVAGAMTAADFIKQSEQIIERLHEQSVDLTRAVGAEIPDSIWDKYHAGDKTVFSKWFAKVLGAADKRRVRDLFKADAVFRSQATQFVRGFAKMLSGAEQTDNRDMITATLLKTDLGQMYLALKVYI